MAIQPGDILIYDRLLPENADGACIACISILGSDLVIDLHATSASMDSRPHTYNRPTPCSVVLIACKKVFLADASLEPMPCHPFVPVKKHTV